MLQKVVRVRLTADSGAEHVSRATQMHIHVYKPCPVDNVDEFGVGDADSNAMDNSVAATLAELPSRALDGVWETYVAH